MPTDSAARESDIASFAPTVGLAELPIDGPPVFGPDNPPWGIGQAALVWVGSVALLLLLQVIATSVYLFFRLHSLSLFELQATLVAEPNFIFVSLISVIPAHLSTLLLVWAVVTSSGKRQFKPMVGWSWGENFGLWDSVAVAFGLWALGLALTSLLGGGKTDLDEIVASSLAARYAVAFMATFSAPIVEEAVYRGVMYPALQRKIGMLWSVVAVSTLFTLVHVMQYRNNLGVIAAVSLLSLTLTIVRAKTGRLLPCYVIHLVFNGITCFLLLTEPFYQQFVPVTDPAGAALLTVACAGGLVP